MENIIFSCLYNPDFGEFAQLFQRLDLDEDSQKIIVITQRLEYLLHPIKRSSKSSEFSENQQYIIEDWKLPDVSLTNMMSRPLPLSSDINFGLRLNLDEALEAASGEDSGPLSVTVTGVKVKEKDVIAHLPDSMEFQPKHTHWKIQLETPKSLKKLKNEKIKTKTLTYNFGCWDTRIINIKLKEGYFILEPFDAEQMHEILLLRCCKLKLRSILLSISKYPTPTQFELGHFQVIKTKVDDFTSSIKKYNDEKKMNPKIFNIMFTAITRMETLLAMTADFLYFKDAFYPWRFLGPFTRFDAIIGLVVAVGGYVPPSQQITTNRTNIETNNIDVLFFGRLIDKDTLIPFFNPEKQSVKSDCENLEKHDLKGRIIRLITPFEQWNLLNDVESGSIRLPNPKKIDPEIHKQKTIEMLKWTPILETHPEFESNFCFLPPDQLKVYDDEQ